MDQTELAIRQLGQTDDVLSFVVIEQLLKSTTKDRGARYKPSSILSGGLRDWQRSRQVSKDVNQLCDDMWLDLVRRVMVARNDLAEWQASARLRELQFAESLRQEWRHFEAVEKPRAQFYHELEIEKIKELNKGGDPAWTVSRTLDSFDAVNERLQQIAQSNASGPEKHQQAHLLIESIKSSLNRPR